MSNEAHQQKYLGSQIKIIYVTTVDKHQLCIPPLQNDFFLTCVIQNEHTKKNWME